MLPVLAYTFKPADRYHMMSLSSGIYNTTQMNLSMKQNQGCGESAGGYQEGRWWENRISRCKPLHTGRTNSKILLRSIGNYVQYPGINYNGKISKNMKKNVCMRITESPRCTAEINIVNQPYFNKIKTK